MMAGLSACASPDQTGDARVVASVGESTLVWGDIRQAVPYSVWQADSLAAATDFAQKWVLRHLMAQQAAELGLQETPDLQQRLAAMRTDLLVESLRERVLAEMTDAFSVTDDELTAWYDSLGTRFAYASDMVALEVVSAAQLPEAVRLKSELPAEATPAQVFLSLEEAVATYPLFAAFIRTSPTGVASPIRNAGGSFTFVRVNGRIPAGSAPPLESIRPRLEEWIRIEKMRVGLLRYEQNLMEKARTSGAFTLSLP